MRFAYLILCLVLAAVLAFSAVAQAEHTAPLSTPSQESLPSMGQLLKDFTKSTGMYGYLFPASGEWTEGIGRIIMVGIGILLLFLAIQKRFEPLILVPMGFGCLLSNIPLSGISEPGGFSIIFTRSASRPEYFRSLSLWVSAP